MKKGRKVKGEIEIGNIVQAKQQLRGNGIRDLSLLQIKPKKKSSLNVDPTWGRSVPSRPKKS